MLLLSFAMSHIDGKIVHFSSEVQEIMEQNVKIQENTRTEKIEAIQEY